MNKILSSSETMLADGSSILIALPAERVAAAFAEAFSALGWRTERGGAADRSTARRLFDVVIRPAEAHECGGGEPGVAVVAHGAPGRQGAQTMMAIFASDAPLFDIAAAALSLSRAAKAKAKSYGGAPEPRLVKCAAPPERAQPKRDEAAGDLGETAAALSKLPFREAERLIITAAIRDCGTVPKAARRLGLSPSTLYRKIEAWN